MEIIISNLVRIQQRDVEKCLDFVEIVVDDTSNGFKYSNISFY